MRLLMMLTLTLLAGCWRQEPPVIMDHTRGHQLAQDTEMYLWLRLPDGTFVKQLTKVPMDTYIMPAELIERKP